MTENRPDMSLAEQYGAALEWWRDAGVDCDFSDEAEAWLKEAEEPAAKEMAAPKKKAEAPPAPSISATDLPQDLSAFREWWVSPESRLPAGPGQRIAPRGEAGAKLLFLVPMPEMDDRDALLGGPQGIMLANICKALGIAPDVAYFASAIPAHMAMPDWDALGADGLGAAVHHHIALARPERVLLFGSKLPALLGHDPAAPPEGFTQVGDIPALATFAPERLLDHPRQRSRLWQRLLEWTAQK